MSKKVTKYLLLLNYYYGILILMPGLRTQGG